MHDNHKQRRLTMVRFLHISGTSKLPLLTVYDFNRACSTA
jgi:hypothetical protein